MTNPTAHESITDVGKGGISHILSSVASLKDIESIQELPETRAIVGGGFVLMHQYANTAGRIPAGDYDYHSAFPAFTQYVQQQSAALVKLMEHCFHLLPVSRRPTLRRATSCHNKKEQLLESPLEKNGSLPSRLGEIERTLVMEAIDSMLENTDVVLDEVKGRKLRGNDQLQVTFGSELVPTSSCDERLSRSMNETEGSSSTISVRSSSSSSFTVNTSSGLARVSRVIRPQLVFKTPVDNSRDTEFVPHYADEHGVVHTGRAGEHPFEATIKAFQPPSCQLLPKPEIPYVPLHQCPLIFVDTVECLKKMIEELLQVEEIAVDLEHHDFYSFLGFTCLIQISTRIADYIVDCLKLRDEMKLLAPVFLNPSILKVFHGAKEDIRWLQKDFSLYVVNFFDTGIALQTLHMPYGLSFAVDHFCQVKLEKKYQKADWRIRPIPSEMIHYARQDTHYLLYVHDRLKSMLLNAESHTSLGNLLLHVYQASKTLSLELYKKPEFDPENSYIRSLDRALAGLNSVQRRVAQYVYNWRDEAAREVDDSPVAVLHQSSLLAIASKLPRTAKELLQCAHPVSATFRAQASKIAEVIRSFIAEADQRTGPERSLSSSSAAIAWHDIYIPRHRKEGAAFTSYAAHVDPTCNSFGSPMGIFRPMTGSFPSISMPRMLHPSFVSPNGIFTRTAATSDFNIPDACIGSTNDVKRNNEKSFSYPLGVLDTNPYSAPSGWILGMRQVSKCLESRPRPHVPLPGADILEIVAQRYQEAHKRRRESGKDQEEGEKQTSKRDRDDEPEADDNEGDRKKARMDSADFTRGACLTLVEHSTTTSSEVLPHSNSEDNCNNSHVVESNLPKGPFAMRQVLGIGPKNRRQAKKETKEKQA